MKTALITSALFVTLIGSCYMADRTGQSIYGLIQAAAIFGMGAVLVRKLKLT